MDLDRFDRQLIKLVQDDAGLTAEQLAASIGLSASAIQRRLRRLREEGVILRDVAVVDPRFVGNPAFFVTTLHVESEQADLLMGLRQWLSTQEQIQQVFYVAGEADFILVVSAPDMRCYDSFMARMLDENPNVRRFTTNVVLNTVKRGLTVPIAVPESE
jgi:Lrp/AsnC family transcriptional regulator, leucine-responsive regulatory protein